MKTLCFIFLCSLTAVNAATVNIGAFGVTSTTPAIKTYVGPLKLVDDPALGFTLDINGTYGTGANEIGFKMQVGAKTNDNPGCTEFKTIKMDATFQMTMPSAVTTVLGNSALDCFKKTCTLVTGGPSFTGIDILPNVTALTSEIKLPQQTYDVSSLTPPYADYELKLSPLLGTDKEKVMNFLGIEFTLILALSELQVYKKGMEVPVYMKFEILKTSIMTTPGSDNCGARGNKVCGTQTCAATITTLAIAKCHACKYLCDEIKDIVKSVAGSGKTAVVDDKADLLGALKYYATSQNVTLPDNIKKCTTNANVTCMGIGNTDKCPSPSPSPKDADDLDGAGTNSFYLMSYLAVFAVYAMLYEL